MVVFCTPLLLPVGDLCNTCFNKAATSLKLLPYSFDAVAGGRGFTIGIGRGLVVVVVKGVFCFGLVAGAWYPMSRSESGGRFIFKSDEEEFTGKNIRKIDASVD